MESNNNNNKNTSPTLQGQSKNFRSQPEWKQPKVSSDAPLLVNNSLTNSKVPFIPQNADGRTVTWYTCGPTVYDASHMGHARNYITFDILRRVMRDYFGYNVQYVMNITDIDDKIILRAREKGITHTELSRFWENSFFEDMKSLNVLPPDALTRVTEYVPQIVDYVQKIIDNGYAYESNGSVYFNTQAFQKDHFYGKLEPNSVGDNKLVAEGEGSLSVTTDKRHPSDFALWKKSKEGEPKWQSKWGEGRPGWHIECSAMASDILGESLDIHSGGVDLKFPHHDNEIAQSEAHFHSNQWVNYFIHSGHLMIDGMKMSKSLKNFITIQEALQKYTPRQMRLLFLLHKYDKPLDYSDKTMTFTIEQEKTFVEFFHKVKSVIREKPLSLEQFWTQDEKDLSQFLEKTKADVHKNLLDNFNTRDALKNLADLISKTNIYITKYTTTEGQNPRVSLLQAISDYITYIFRAFGLVEGQTIGFGSSEGANVEERLTPILDAIVKFRDQIRTGAIAKDTSGILRLCDELRDEVLPLLGVKLDDKAAGSQSGALWKFENIETLKKEIQQKKEIEAKKKAEKEERLRKEKEKLEISKISPSEYFASQKEKFSKFDANGFPTHDKDGKEITASQGKKLTKELSDHTKNHEKYLNSLKSDK